MERVRIDPIYPELIKTSVFLTRIPIEVKDFEDVIDKFNKNDSLKENVDFRAKQIAKDIGLTEVRVKFNDRGMASVTVSPIMACPCMGIDAEDWQDRDVQYPAFSTHNVDTPQQYLALTSIVFHYLNILDTISKSKNAHQ